MHRQKSKLEKQLEAMKKIEEAKRKYDNSPDRMDSKLKSPVKILNQNLLSPDMSTRDGLRAELRPIHEHNSESSNDNQDQPPPPMLSLRRPRVQVAGPPKEIKSNNTMSSDEDEKPPPMLKLGGPKVKIAALPKEEDKKMEDLSDDSSSSSFETNIAPPIMKKSSLKKTHSEDIIKEEFTRNDMIKRRSRTKRGDSLVLNPGDKEKFQSLKDLPNYSRKKSVMNFDRKKLEDVSDEDDENYLVNEIVYGDNYFIHDYSEESKSGTMET